MNWLNGKAQFCIEHKVFFFFIVLAASVRLLFWLYTGRVWEDALITLTPALNVWDGLGLTHHPSEPRVHSFTSPLSVLIPLVGEGLIGGLLTLRLTALIGGVLGICYAYGICRHLKLHISAIIMLLGYLSLDQLQIFFGMSGMETQVATAVMLGGAYYFLKERWVALGVCCGLATIARPEFFAFVGLVGLWLVAFNRQVAVKVVGVASCITFPWYLFAHFYFGSIIPNTVHAKTWGGKIGLFSSSKERIMDYFSSSWAHIAPFKEWWFAQEVPLPDIVLKMVVFSLLSLFILGAIKAVKDKNWKLLVLVMTVLAFAIYRSVSVINSYFMWYLPPFMALLFVVAAVGLSYLSKKIERTSVVVGVLITLAYGMHIPYSFPIEKQVQEKIEYGVRSKVGKELDALMGADDSVFLEPLGYIGFEIRGKTTYDFPGLSSPIVIDVIRNLPQVRMGGVIDQLRPEFLVLRPHEMKEFREYFEETSSEYKEVMSISAEKGLDWSVGGYRISAPDSDFTIYSRED